MNCLSCPTCTNDMNEIGPDTYRCSKCGTRADQLNLWEFDMKEKSPKKSKYNNIKTTVAGYKFDSRAEANYYLFLLSEKKFGRVKEIELQPKFILQDKFVKGGVKWPGITYKADFRVTYTNGLVEIIDVKGAITKEFRLKQKIFEYRYPDLTIKLVK
jgi:hypothetical protein